MINKFKYNLPLLTKLNGYHTMFDRDREIRRVARIALEKAQQRRPLLTIAHKENALPYLPWTRLVEEKECSIIMVYTSQV